MPILLFLCAMFLVARPAAAQSTYLGGAVAGDIVRVSGGRGDLAGAGGNGESVGWSVRIGTPLGGRWGVDAELVRGGSISSEATVTFPPFPSVPDPLFPPGTPTGAIANGAFPRLELERRERFSAFSTTAWFRHDLTLRASLVYLGGVAFVRAERELETVLPSFICVGDISLPRLCGPTIAMQTSESVSYSAGPTVGVDLRFALTDRWHLVTGARLLTVDAGGQRGWLVRPSAGVHWMF